MTTPPESGRSADGARSGGPIAGVELTHAISHAWERAAALRDLRAGRRSRDELCDADFLLRAAAEHHGIVTQRECPVCAEPLYLTRWIYGDVLGRRSGSARSPEEISAIVAEVGEITVHTVEVCRKCRWNYLLEAAVARPTC